MSEVGTVVARRVLRRASKPVRLSWGLRRRQSSLLDKVTVTLVTAIVLTAVIGPFIAPDPYIAHIDEAFRAPGTAHWLGTDEHGRDVFWRIVVGCRVTLGVAITVVIGYATTGTIVATVASVGPRWLGDVLMRITDAVLAFPSLLFALAVTAAIGAGLRSVMVVLILTGWPMSARLLRGLMRETMEMPFVAGARTLGVSRTRLMVHHVLPHALPTLWVKWAGDIGNTVITIGGLSFVGAGAQPPSPEWGAMVASAQGFVSTYWWIALFPGLAIAVTTASFGLLGDMLQVHSDPAVRQRLAVARTKGVSR